MLGLVAASQLMRATLLSAFLVTGALILLTAIPWILQEETAEETATEATGLQPPPGTLPAPAAVPEPKLDQPPASLVPLGVNETKKAPLESNPLEDQGGSFLDELE
jgi:hypothetical protein